MLGGWSMQAYNKSKMLDGCHLEKSKRRYLYCSTTDWHEIWHSDAYWPSEPNRQLKFWTFKNPRWPTVAILKNGKNGHISVTV